MIYILSILFTLSFIFYSKYQFKLDSSWHIFGVIMRILTIITPFLCELFPSHWTDYALAGALNIVIWEVGINKIALKQDWFYVGFTSFLDRKLGKVKWYIYFSLLLIALLIKLKF